MIKKRQKSKTEYFIDFVILNIIGFVLAQHGSSHFDGMAAQRHCNNSELYKQSTMAPNPYANVPAPKIITFDHHTNPFVFKCELSFLRKIMVSLKRF